MKTLLESIRDYNGIFPRKELEQIIERKEEAIPLLLQIVEEVRQSPEQFTGESLRIDHTYAIYLLAQFRVKELYPLLLEIVSLPIGLPDRIFGDMITQGIGRILATVYDGNILPLQRLIENSEVDDFVRGQGMLALVILVLQGRLEREMVISYFGELLRSERANFNLIVNALLVDCCNDLYPEELYDEIERLYEEVDELMIDLFDIDHTLLATKEAHLSSRKQSHHHQFIDDTIREIEWWACFEHNQGKRKQPARSYTTESNLKINPPIKVEKIGRNAPCPCNSGKKYKKCCGW